MPEEGEGETMIEYAAELLCTWGLLVLAVVIWWTVRK